MPASYPDIFQLYVNNNYPAVHLCMYTTCQVIFFSDSQIMRFGVPRCIHSDQGREFQSDLVHELAQLLGIH